MRQNESKDRLMCNLDKSIYLSIMFSIYIFEDPYNIYICGHTDCGNPPKLFLSVLQKVVRILIIEDFTEQSSARRASRIASGEMFLCWGRELMANKRKEMIRALLPQIQYVILRNKISFFLLKTRMYIWLCLLLLIVLTAVDCAYCWEGKPLSRDHSAVEGCVIVIAVEDGYYKRRINYSYSYSLCLYLYYILWKG